MIEFRYDFGERLDLSKFIRQAPTYIEKYSEIQYNIYTKDFKIQFSIEKTGVKSNHFVRISVFSLERDADGEILNLTRIFLAGDTRFDGFKLIQDLFNPYVSEATFQSSSITDIVTKASDLIKILHKINYLKAFV